MATPDAAASTDGERALPVAPSAPDTTDWPTQATDSIVRVVGSIRDKTSGPAVTAARAVVYGTIVAALLLPLFVILLVGSMRAVERFLVKVGDWTGWAFLEQPMWLVYLLFGLLFFGVGLRLWARARKPAPEVR